MIYDKHDRYDDDRLKTINETDITYSATHVAD